MIPAVPQFCAIGPLFHILKDMLGGSPTAALAGVSVFETMMAYGAETRNAQMAAGISKSRLHNPIVPFGPGVLIHLTRNFLASSGLRILSDPCRTGLSSFSEKIGAGVISDNSPGAVAADLFANCIASAISMPLHQLYSFAVIQAGRPDGRVGVQEARTFLRRQFLVEGTNRLSRLAGRDIVLRCGYNAGILTLFGLIERTSVELWKRQDW